MNHRSRAGAALCVALSVALGACASDPHLLGRSDAGSGRGRDGVAPVDTASCGTRLNPAGCACDPSTDRERECFTFSGPVCRGGRSRCLGTGELGQWSACEGQVEGRCPCAREGQVQTCGTGAEGEPGVVASCGPGTATCRNGAWSECVPPVCPPDGGAADGGGATCARGITPPRLVAPLSTARVTSWRPSLRWQLAAGTVGARIELCRDRACATVVESLDVVGTTARPSRELRPLAAAPAEVVYWRAVGLVRDADGSTRAGCDASPVWEFFVGHRSAPVDTSWGTVLDVDADGFADLLVAGLDTARLHRGGAGGLGAAAAATLAVPRAGPATGPGPSFADLANAGDVNGDGFGDVATITTLEVRVGGATARLQVHHGGASGLGTAAALSVDLATTSQVAGGPEMSALAAAGDVNGDGYADVALAVDQTVRVYFGSATGLRTDGAATLRGESAREVFGRAVAGAGDVNGDGFGDLVVGTNAVPARTYVFLGSAAGPVAPPAAVLAPAFDARSVVGIGDVDGNGFADVLVAGWAWGVTHADHVPRVAVYLSGARGPDAARPIELQGLPSDVSKNTPICVGLDTNRDGAWEAACGVYQRGLVLVYPGGAAGTAPHPSLTLRGDGGAAAFGRVTAAADADGDGYTDLGVTASNRAQLFPAGPSGLASSASWTLMDPAEAGIGTLLLGAGGGS